MKIRRVDTQGESKAAQKEALRVALVEHSGNVTKTAQKTGLSRSRINELLDEYELRELVGYLRALTGWNGLGRPPLKSVR